MIERNTPYTKRWGFAFALGWFCGGMFVNAYWWVLS